MVLPLPGQAAFSSPLSQAFSGRSHLLLAAAATAVIVELLWRVAVARKGYDALAAAGTFGVALGNALFGIVNSLGLAAVFGLAYRLAPVHWPVADWRTWAIGWVGVEFAYYWFHRLSHEVRWLWASHAVHHSPEQLTFLAAIRLGWTNLISGGWIVYLPLVLAGFDPRVVFALLALDLNYQFFLHTEARIRLGPLEWAFNTPAHHQVHHARNPAYLDRNYGGMVIVFDRLFGTFAREQAGETPRYGLAHPLGRANPFTLALGEWGRLLSAMRQAGGVKAALGVALGRPD